MLSRDFDAEGMPQMAPKGRKSVGLPIERETMLTGPIHSIYKARFAQVVVTFPSSLTPTFPSLILLPFSGSSLRLFFSFSTATNGGRYHRCRYFSVSLSDLF